MRRTATMLLAVGILLVILRAVSGQTNCPGGYGDECADCSEQQCSGGLKCSLLPSETNSALRCLCDPSSLESCHRQLISLTVQRDDVYLQVEVTSLSPLITVVMLCLEDDGEIRCDPVNTSTNDTSTSTTFQTLEPGRLYPITVVVNDSLADKEFKIVSEKYTMPAKPRDVRHFTYGQGGLKVTWYQKGRAVFPQCRLIATNQTEGPPPSVSTLEMCEWFNLPPFVHYAAVEITAYNKQSDKAMVTYDLSYTYVPDLVEKAEVTAFTQTSIEVTVSERREEGLSVDYYVIGDSNKVCFLFSRHASCGRPRELRDCERVGDEPPATVATPTRPTTPAPTTTTAKTTRSTTTTTTTRTTTLSSSPKAASTQSAKAAGTWLATTTDKSTINLRPVTETLDNSSRGRRVARVAREDLNTPDFSGDSQDEENSVVLVARGLNVSSTSTFTLTPWFCESFSGKPILLRPQVQVTKVLVTVVEDRRLRVEWEASPDLSTATYTVYITDNVHVQTETSSCVTDRQDGAQTLCKTKGGGVSGERFCTGPAPLAFWEYSVTVKTKTLLGTAASSTQVVTTWPSAPGVVPVLVVTPWVGNSKPQCDGLDLSRRDAVCVTWTDPCPRDRNSFIERYEWVVANKDRSLLLWDGAMSQFRRSEGHSKYRANGKLHEYHRVFHITPGSSYNLTMYAVSEEGLRGAAEARQFRVPDVPAPSALTGAQISRLVPEGDVMAGGTSISFSLTSTRFLFQDGQHDLLGHGMIVTAGDAQPLALSSLSDYDSYPSYSDLAISGQQTDRKRRSASVYVLPKGGYRVNDKALSVLTDSAVTVTIGDDETCSMTQGEKFCDGPLQPGVSYSLWVFRCNEADCTNIVLIENRVTATKVAAQEDNSTLYIVIAIVLVLAVLGTAAFLVYYFHFRKRNDKDNVEWTAKISLRRFNKTRPMKLNLLENIVAKKQRDDCLLLRDEFVDIKSISEIKPHTHTLMELNLSKNRYADIVTYDHSRVILSEDHQGSDYINANYLPGYTRDKEYIATQGPLPYTACDFWRMVWKYRTPIIVMLTMPKENGKIKCDQYWPTERGEVIEHDDVVITNTSVSTVNDYNITTLTLANTQEEGEELQVMHFHYLKFPDMTAALPPEAMIEFVTAIRQHVRPDKDGPIVVHCSAGVGRTGTYICVDYLMQFIDSRPMSDSLDIFSLVLKLREDRCLMVQTDEQYVFIHTCARIYMARRRGREDDLGTPPVLDGQPSPFVDISLSTKDGGSIRAAASNENLSSPESDDYSMELKLVSSGPGLPPDKRFPRDDGPLAASSCSNLY